MALRRFALTDLLTCTRASSALVRSAAGVYSSVGNNVLRRSYENGSFCLLAEETRTNLLLNSETLSTQSVTVTNVAHTLTFEGTGTVTLSGASTAGPLVGTGATDRVSLTFTPTAGSLTLTVSGSVTYANLEIGTFGTSPIITTGTAVTRQADRIKLNDGLLAQVYGGGPLSVLTEFEMQYVAGGSGFPRVWVMDDGTANNLFRANVTESTGVTNAAATTGAASVYLDSAAYTSGAVLKMATRFQADSFATSRNGGAVTTDTSGALPAGLINLGVGNQGRNTANDPARLLRLRKLIVKPVAMSDADLQLWSA